MSEIRNRTAVRVCERCAALLTHEPLFDTCYGIHVCEDCMDSLARQQDERETRQRDSSLNYDD